MKLSPFYVVALTVILTFMITSILCFIVHVASISLGANKTLPGIVVCICASLPNNFLLARSLLDRLGIK